MKALHVLLAVAFILVAAGISIFIAFGLYNKTPQGLQPPTYIPQVVGNFTERSGCGDLGPISWKTYEYQCAWPVRIVQRWDKYQSQEQIQEQLNFSGVTADHPDIEYIKPLQLSNLENAKII